MSENKSPYYERNYFFNDISTIKHWYPIIRLIANEKGDINTLRNNTIDKPFYAYKKIQTIKKKMLRDQENDGTPKNLDDYKLDHLQGIITEIRNWTNIIYFNDRSQNYEIQKQYREKLAFPLNENKLKFFLFSHLREYIGGDLFLKRRNTSFFLFLSFLIEQNKIKIIKEKSSNGSDPYLKLLDKFENYLNVHNFNYHTQKGNALEWNYGKIKNILDVYVDLSLLSHYKGEYFLFGDLEYYNYVLKNLLRIVLSNTKIEKEDDNLMLPVKEFLKIINDNLIYLPILNTTDSKLPLFIEEVLNNLEKRKFIESSDLGDKKEFYLENGDSIKLIYIDIKKVMNTYV